jgi:transposase InsO family protein
VVHRTHTLYLAIVLDLYSRRIVGWATSNRLKKNLALDALRRALVLLSPPPGLIQHADRGSQYCSHDYQRLLKAQSIIRSMSGKGNCYDNAIVETVFKTIKQLLQSAPATFLFGIQIAGIIRGRNGHHRVKASPPNTGKSKLDEDER